MNKLILILCLLLCGCAIQPKQVENKLTKREFVEVIKKHTFDLQTSVNFDYKILTAQICLETGYGTSRLCREQNNLLGIKQPKAEGGKYESFSSYEECLLRFYQIVAFNGYRDLLQIAYTGDVKKYAAAIQASGWATDKMYGKKLIAVYDSLF